MTPLDSLIRLLPPAVRPLLTPRATSDKVRQLAEILQVAPSELATIRLGQRYHYRPFVNLKRDGRERRLLAPSPALKRLQRSLLANCLSQILIHPCATAFFPGASTVRNARPHANSRLVATVDLRDFFESTRATRVRRVFLEQGWRDEALATLIRICVFRNGLPQGAPTSPCLSNLVNVQLDERLEALARQSRAMYTRYGDDLTFSWSSERMPSCFQAAVEDAIAAAGYEIQPRKGWQIKSIHQRPVVTGIVLVGGGRLRIPWALRLEMAMLRWQSLWPGGQHAATRLRGYQAYDDMVTLGYSRAKARRRQRGRGRARALRRAEVEQASDQDMPDTDLAF